MVAVPDDASIKQRKGAPRPITPERDRLRLLDSLKPVDYVVLADKYIGAVEEIAFQLQPGVFALFNDWPPSDLEKLRKAFVKAKVMTFEPIQPLLSTTAIIDRVQELGKVRRSSE